jgi:hypothetical protein
MMGVLFAFGGSVFIYLGLVPTKGGKSPYLDAFLIALGIFAIALGIILAGHQS